jgi:hypothetical protein
MYMYIHVHMHHTYIRVCIYMYAYAYVMYVCTSMYVCTYIHVHVHMHTSTYIIDRHAKCTQMDKVEFSLLFLVPQLLSVSWWWQKSRGRVHHFPARYRTSTTSRRRSPAISVTCHFHLPGPVGRSAAPLRLDPPSHTAIIRSHADGIAQQDITNAGTRPGARLN